MRLTHLRIYELGKDLTNQVDSPDCASLGELLNGSRNYLIAEQTR